MRMTGSLTLALAMLGVVSCEAQDVPGIEICTVEKTMERRTSCLQSNVEFLVETINRLRTEHDQKLDTTNRQIAALQSVVVALQKSLVEIQSAKAAATTTPAKDAPAIVKDGVK